MTIFAVPRRFQDEKLFETPPEPFGRPSGAPFWRVWTPLGRLLDVSWELWGASRAALGHTWACPNRAFVEHWAEMGSKMVSRVPFGSIWGWLLFDVRAICGLCLIEFCHNVGNMLARFQHKHNINRMHSTSKDEKLTASAVVGAQLCCTLDKLHPLLKHV